MRKQLIGILSAGAMVLAGGALADTIGARTYEVLFKDGALDTVPRTAALVYDRDVVNDLRPEAAARDSGTITLDFAGEDGGEAVLTFRQGEGHRGIGSFPVSVGNPIIMYFVETVARDMAETAGGSPFYIRNRMKEALLHPAEVTQGDAAFGDGAVPVQTLILHPFREDPNRDRMHGFGELTLAVTMSEDVPGWYHTLEARVPGGDGEGPIYLSTVALEKVETGR